MVRREIQLETSCAVLQAKPSQLQLGDRCQLNQCLNRVQAGPALRVPATASQEMNSPRSSEKQVPSVSKPARRAVAYTAWHNHGIYAVEP